MSEGTPNLEKWFRVRRTAYETPEQRARLDALGCSGCSLCKPPNTNCSGCGKPLRIDNEEILGCAVYCDDCPFPNDPCETCGKPECDGECCNCEYFVRRRAGT